MTSPGLLILALVVAIAVILFCIIVLKLNAAIGMVIACLVMGVMGGLDLLTTTSTIASGFGNMMTSIGLPVGFGTILGQLMNDSGAAEVIADKIVSAFPAKKAIWGLSIAGFILSIPVFFDVTFIILIPIGITIASKIDLKMGYVTGCLTIGATTAHCVVPPTPNPLAAADIFGFDLGIMLIVGLIVGFITVMVSNFIYIKIHDQGIWNEEKDVNHSSNVTEELVAAREGRKSQEDRTKKPSLFISLLPIIIPVVCILFGTIGGALFAEKPVICSFLGDKVIAMLLGTLGAYLVSLPYLGKNGIEKSAGEALKSAGVVLLIYRCRRFICVCYYSYRNWRCNCRSVRNKYNIYITGYVPCIWYWYGFPCGTGIRYCCRHDFHGYYGNDCTSYRMPSGMDCTCMSLRR